MGTLWQMHQVDPRTADRVALDNFGSLISGAIIYNDPAQRRYCLSHHRGKGLFDKGSLIMRRRDENVFHQSGS